MIRPATVTLAIFPLLLAATAQADGIHEPEPIALPAVPASVDPRGREPQPEPAIHQGPAAPASGVTRISLAPGTNEIIPVAQGYVNRISTAFADPQVMTASDESIEPRANVLYVTPNGDRPITLFVTDGTDETRAMSLTLVPLEIPPQELELAFAGLTAGFGARPNGAAARWEDSQPFVDTVADILRDLSLGRMPQSYELAVTGPQTPAPPACTPQPHWHVQFQGGQYLRGGRLEVFVGLVTNTGVIEATFDEAACGSADVAAVAAWPTVLLPPGQSAELFVIRRMIEPEDRPIERPSLLLQAGGF